MFAISWHASPKVERLRNKNGRLSFRDEKAGRRSKTSDQNSECDILSVRNLTVAPPSRSGKRGGNQPTRRLPAEVLPRSVTSS